MIEVKNLTHDYEGKGKVSVDNVSFTIEDGQIFGFLGPSGAGKSTTQQLMTGLLRIQAGSVHYNGKSIDELGTHFYNQIGVSFEHPNLYGKLSGRENLEYFRGMFSVPTRDPLELLELLGLRDAADRRAAAYSKGMKQRLVFARSLLNSPSILFLDEPTSGLDPATAERVKEIIIEEKKRGATIFLTTHNMQTADELCDVVAFLNDGRIEAMDAPRELKLRYGEKSLAVEHRDNGQVHKDILFPEREADRLRIQAIMESGRMETMHSQEASLEQIFIAVTGRGLS